MTGTLKLKALYAHQNTDPLIRGDGVDIIFSVCVRRLEVGIKSMMPQSINKRHAVAKSTGVREPKDFVLPGVSINIYIQR
jgi:hypothetical protein